MTAREASIIWRVKVTVSQIGERAVHASALCLPQREAIGSLGRHSNAWFRACFSMRATRVYALSGKPVTEVPM